MRVPHWSLYDQMLTCRLFEEAVAALWREGQISGEMHLGTGEEAINAGVVGHLKEGDALALDHRGTAPMLLRGVDPLLLLREMMGRADGLCGGRGGHMHLFSRAHLAASSGIVGASGPAGAGFALAAQMQRPGSIAVSFFGEGALNQGMLMEALNLAAVWSLPLLFVCKDDSWGITTDSGSSSGGGPRERAHGLGIETMAADGLDAADVWETAGTAITRLRAGAGPLFLHLNCVHLEGHFLGYQLLRLTRHPLRELPPVALPLTRAFLTPGGGSPSARLAGLSLVLGAIVNTLRDPRRKPENDPLVRARRPLLARDPDRLLTLEKEVQERVGSWVAAALEPELV